MAKNLQKIKARSSALSLTAKVTSIMKVISAAKLRKSIHAMQNSLPYLEEIETVFVNAFTPAEIQKLQQIDENNYYLFAISANRGLCGKFNNNIIKATMATIESLSAKYKNITIYSIGDKINNFLKKYKNTYNVNCINENPENIEAIYNLKNIILENNKLPCCSIIYTHFYSSVKQETIHKKLLPLKYEATKETEDIYAKEANKKELFDKLMGYLVEAKIYNCFLHNIKSEHCTRMMTMDRASQNAATMIEKLTLQYNKSRQENITTDLIEIISGAESLTNQS